MERYPLSLNTQFRGIAKCTPGCGNIVGFWDDLIGDKIHVELYPNLLHFASDSKASLMKLISFDNLLEYFNIPMTRQAYNEFLALSDELVLLSDYIDEDKDVWTFIWGQPKYSSSRYYQFQFQNVHPDRSVIWIWETKCIPKINFLCVYSLLTD